MNRAVCPAGTMIEVPAGDVAPTMEDLVALKQDKALHLLGHLKPIEDVAVGDLVMGPDGNFHRILEIFEDDRTVDLMVVKVRHRSITIAADAPLLCWEANIPAGDLATSEDWVAIRCGSKVKQAANGVELGQWIATRRVDSLERIPKRNPQKLYGLRCGSLDYYEANGFYVGGFTE